MPHKLIISYYNIQDIATGGKRRVHELARALAPDVLLLQPEPTHPLYEGHPIPVDFGRRKVLINWGIFNYYWPANRAHVRSVTRTLKPSVIIMNSIWCHAPLDGLNIPLVLDAQNVDALAIEERYGRHHVFTRLVRAQERRVVEKAARVFCCSEVDAEVLVRIYGVPDHKISIAPNGVTLRSPTGHDEHADAIRKRFAGKTILLFMGKLDYSPNVEALEFLSRHVLPDLEIAQPGSFMCVVTGGPGLPTPLRHPRIHYAGQVPDVMPWLSIADICLAPVFSGSGTRLKILEYLGAGKPVVATPKAAEGLTVRAGWEICLAEKSDFTAAILRLASDREIAEAMAGRGRTLVLSKYTWDRTADIWRAGIESIR